MDFAFNELSQSNLSSADDLDNFYYKVKRLQETLKLPQFPSIVFNDDFTIRKYNGNQTVYDLLKESNLSTDEHAHLLSVIVNAPYSTRDYSLDSEYRLDGELTMGMQYACVEGTRCISIPGSDWNSYSYTLDKLSLCEDTGGIRSCKVEVEHLGDLDKASGTWLEKYIPETSFSCARTFLKNIPRKYKRVKFSEEAIDSLNRLNRAKLNQLERAMWAFEEYCNKYWVSNFRYQGITKLGVAIKDESDVTMSKYGNQRIFLDESGSKYTYRLHFNISEDFRGYIKPTDQKNIFIGYLGPHLSTVRHK